MLPAGDISVGEALEKNSTELNWRESTMAHSETVSQIGSPMFCSEK